MKISQIKAGMDGITVIGRIVYIGIRKRVETKFGPAYVARAILEDKTGRITLNLWREQIDMVKEGDIILIENGFVRTYKDRLELNVGSRGKIIRLKESGKPAQV